ncbi:hypothetical protein ASZ78_014516 [Callipepla squamata]|uniref:Amine oxidase domain-containing protein n=1 Tax=Callipepla squamata TaxID=9009 RepID=A0A226MBJ0_CALSU|nr:hypothetical protein ASZ78_014516 [Callipepla squamata]
MERGGGGRRVLVVGAGMAALGAAQRLRGPGSVRLLEAGGRVGGRVCSLPFASGLAELGAHWIHGPSEGNPVFRLASGYGLLGPGAAEEENQRVEAKGLLSGVTYGSSGKVLSPELVNGTRRLFSELLDSAQALAGTEKPPSTSVGQYMREEIPRLAAGWDEDEDDKRLRLAVLSACLKLECCISGTHSMDMVALGSFGEYTSLPGLDCTFPGEDESPLTEPSTDPEANWFKKLIGFVVLQPPEQLGHVLCGFIAGKESEYMETLSDGEVLSTMTHVLRTLTGNPHLPTPRSMLRSRWHSAPYIRGSYSYVAVGSSGEDIDTLAQPLPEDTSDPRAGLVPPPGPDPHPAAAAGLFAGEATQRSFYSTTHGALLSGWREAERLNELSRAAARS